MSNIGLTLAFAYMSKHYVAERNLHEVSPVSDTAFRLRVHPANQNSLREVWKNPIIVSGTNCMSFCLDREDTGASHPNIFSKAVVNRLHEGYAQQDFAEILQLSIKSSGFKKIRVHANTPGKAHVVAITFDPASNGDFHCYRLFDEGWLHKPGIGAVESLDGALPDQVDAGRFEHFMGYYLVPQEGVEIISSPPKLVLDYMN